MNSFTKSVDLKYITNYQTFDVFYEGQIRRFVVSAVSSQQHAQETPETLVDDLQNMSVDVPPQLWTFGWDTAISIEGDESKNSEGSTKVYQKFHSFEYLAYR